LSNPLQNFKQPTTKGDYTLYERSVVAKNKKKKKMANLIEIGGLRVGKKIWANVGLCDDVVMRGVDVVAVSGVWWLFVVV
jgi:hypothetical protein